MKWSKFRFYYMLLDFLCLKNIWHFLFWLYLIWNFKSDWNELLQLPNLFNTVFSLNVSPLTVYTSVKPPCTCLSLIFIEWQDNSGEPNTQENWGNPDAPPPLSIRFRFPFRLMPDKQTVWRACSNSSCWLRIFFSYCVAKPQNEETGCALLLFFLCGASQKRKVVGIPNLPRMWLSVQGFPQLVFEFAVEEPKAVWRCFQTSNLHVSLPRREVSHCLEKPSAYVYYLSAHDLTFYFQIDDVITSLVINKGAKGCRDQVSLDWVTYSNTFSTWKWNQVSQCTDWLTDAIYSDKWPLLRSRGRSHATAQGLIV